MFFNPNPSYQPSNYQLSSKTAAFLVPILNRMLEQGASINPASNRPYQRRKQYPLGLVLAPVSVKFIFISNRNLISFFLSLLSKIRRASWQHKFMRKLKSFLIVRACVQLFYMAAIIQANKCVILTMDAT
jgi:hypothetical protein